MKMDGDRSEMEWSGGVLGRVREWDWELVGRLEID